MNTTPAQPAADNLETPQGMARLYLEEINLAQNTLKDFYRRGKKITQRYRAALDRQDSTRAGAKFNIFWSNVETLGPATYSKRPVVQVSRRFGDEDPVGRVAGLILERALQYEVDKGLNFHRTVEATVKDRLLPGRGQVWIRYEPQVGERGIKIPSKDNPFQLVDETTEYLADEFTPIDYVYWEDFLHSPGRTWSDVTWVARQLSFTKSDLDKRFGESIKQQGGDISMVKCGHEPFANLDDSGVPIRKAYGETTPASQKRALVWELWDKARSRIVFVSKECEFPLDVKENLPELQDFFPVPEPLNATTTNDELTPVADYLIYQEQLRELDQITNRISLLVEALRVIGVYDSSQKSLQDLLQSGLDNRLVPVDAWAAFAEKGGLKGVMDFLPLDQVVAALEGLYKAREMVKQTVYEITGMADIVRGASRASETLGAQEIKAQFANLRLASRRSQVATFVTTILQIKAQLMCQHYSPETLVKISSADQLADVKANPQILMMALQLLKNQQIRNYRIEVLAESMVEMDERDLHQKRGEFMSTTANFFNALKNIAGIAPEMFPVSLEMLKFVVRGYPVGRSLEGAIEAAQQQIQQRLANPQPPEPDPTEALKLKTNMELEKMRQDGEDRRTKYEGEIQLIIKNLEGRMAELEQQRSQEHETGMQRMDQMHSFMSERASAEDSRREQETGLMAEKESQAVALADQREARMMEAQKASTEGLVTELKAVKQGQEQLSELLTQMIGLLKAPRKRVPKYNKDGDIESVDDLLVQ